MNAVAEATTLMRVLAEPGYAGESVKSAIRRAARRAGVPSGLGKRLWYGEARRIDSETMDRLRMAAGDTTALEEALAQRNTVLARLAACEAALGLPHPYADGGAAAVVGRQSGADDSALAARRGLSGKTSSGRRA